MWITTEAFRFFCTVEMCAMRRLSTDNLVIFGNIQEGLRNDTLKDRMSFSIGAVLARLKATIQLTKA